MEGRRNEREGEGGIFIMWIWGQAKEFCWFYVGEGMRIWGGACSCVFACVCVCVCVLWAGKIWPGWFVDDKKLSFSSGLSLVMLDWHDESLQTGYRLPKHVESHLFFLAISVSIPCLCWYLVGTFLWVSFWLDYGTARTDILRYIHTYIDQRYACHTHT